MNNNRITEKIKEEMAKRNLTIATLAIAMNISRMGCYKVVTGKSKISYDCALRLEAVLEIPATWTILIQSMATLKRHRKNFQMEKR